MTSWQQLDLLGAAAIALIAAAVWIAWRTIRRRKTDFEKLRRLKVNQRGRLGIATITEIEEGSVYYEYNVRGVAYTASQDVAGLREYIPDDADRLIGRPVSLKYTPHNPANSILVCEDWSGLRTVSMRGSGVRDVPDRAHSTT